MMGADEMYASSAQRADDIEARAADWLARRVSEDWAEEQQSGLTAWLAESPAHRVAFLRLEDAWSQTYRLSVLRASTPDRSTKPFRKNIRRILGGTAAVFAIVAATVAAGAYYLSQPRIQIFTTATGSHQAIALADGSQIELNTDTVLRASLGATQRTIWLDKGEAYFQVRHDAMRPFVVIAQGHRVLDIGTKFLVRRDASQLEVAVVEGRVQFDTAAGTQEARSTILTPGDVMLATANMTNLNRQSQQKLTDELGWRHGLLVFDNAHLADVVTEFNRYNAEKIVIADPAVGRLVIGGTFPTTDIGAFRELAQDVLGLHVEKRGDETVVSR